MNHSTSNAPPVARLVAKVAHELNNPLDAVLRFVSLAQRKVESGNLTDVQRHLEDAQFGLQRMAEILRELMELGRQTYDVFAQHASIPLPQILTHAIRIIAPCADVKGIRIRVDYLLPDGRPPQFDLRLSQILGNLLKNAVEASPENSTISLVLAGESPTGGIEPGGSEPRKAIRIALTDAGPGVSRDILPKLFSPFHTTKPKGKGHGLGLAISRELALSLGGTLTVENLALPAHGCQATVTLPV